ncbi:unnamed protein product [Caenorhabditis angaria]|uniref:Glycosyl transferase family 25 domain-containing protein n=1 Tax=Caenorhabditis angaria TaxID=860376 RepID=A0A9P1IFU1_9PELO|nr:unnamed protein product [Caenorhabditis angaria]
MLIIYFLCVSQISTLFPGAEPDEGDTRHIYPIIYIGLGLDTHAHSIPYIFGWLENLEYPKNRVILEIFVGNRGEDSTIHQTKWWIDNTKQHFKNVQIHEEIDENTENWLEIALRTARLKKAEKCLLLTGDTVPTETNILKSIFNEKKHVVVVPVFQSIDGSSNLYADLTESLDLRKNVREEISTFALPLAINLGQMDSSYLTFDSQNLPFFDGPNDSGYVFLKSAENMKIAIWADNQKDYGIFVNPEIEELEDRRMMIRYHLADLLADDKPIPPISRSVRPWVPEKSNLGFDRIYLINLKRRSERLERMQKIFEILGIEFQILEAVDGQNLENIAEKYQILDGYLDPIKNRPMKNGEIGCFLSHFRIWREILEEKLEKVVVFEDDLRFSAGGLKRIREVLMDLEASRRIWDLIYLGRKKQSDKQELWIPQHRHLSSVEYSYWTLGYMLSQEGARKLLTPNPLTKIVPVDEYLPIMFDKHPNSDWSSNFAPRNLEAFTLYPLVVSPQKYTNEVGYISDTEDSLIISEANLQRDPENHGEL